MRGLLIRVGADQSSGGGNWNGPGNLQTKEFVYVAIPEARPVHAGLERPYQSLSSALDKFGDALPPHLENRHMHLDPDFEHLTYGDQGERARQIREKVNPGDLIAFYAGLRPVDSRGSLIYALIGLLVVDKLLLARDLAKTSPDANAHTRRLLSPDAEDIVVVAKPGQSGRLRHFLPIGEYRDRAYRVTNSVLAEWGGLSVKDGYLQRSARLPEFSDAPRFLKWFFSQNVGMIQTNN